MASPPSIKIPFSLWRSIDRLPEPLWVCLREALRRLTAGQLRLTDYPGHRFRYFFRACDCIVVLTWPDADSPATLIRVQIEYSLPPILRNPFS